jgi:hypothetical protein
MKTFFVPQPVPGVLIRPLCNCPNPVNDNVFLSFLLLQTGKKSSSINQFKHTMPKFIIERNVPGVEKLEGRDRQATALKSMRALRDIGPEIQWVHSYISDNKTHCVYVADNADLILEHAEKSGFPANKITEVKWLLEPVDAE